MQCATSQATTPAICCSVSARPSGRPGMASILAFPKPSAASAGMRRAEDVSSRRQAQDHDDQDRHHRPGQFDLVAAIDLRGLTVFVARTTPEIDSPRQRLEYSPPIILWLGTTIVEVKCCVNHHSWSPAPRHAPDSEAALPRRLG